MTKKKPYKHIFFDLDKTLWDFETNSVKALETIIEKFSLRDHISGAEVLFTSYTGYNDYFWDLYRKGEITKGELRKERFYHTLQDFGIENKALGIEIDNFYMEYYPTLPATIDGAKETVKYLSEKYFLYILSNGFHKTQLLKLKGCGLSPYFKDLFTSDKTGYTKPRKEMFMHALSSVNARKQESLMIGDEYAVDILGARNFGIDQIYFCPGDKDHHDFPATFTVKKMEEIREIL